MGCDAYALRSQQSWARANEAGVFNAEIAPVEIKTRKGVESMTADEHPRPSTVLPDLTKLKPVFKPDGRVTAGPASGICDGAASLVVASEEACKENNLVPLSRVVAWARSGCDPSCMGIGPVPAIESVLKATNLSLADIEIVEINEAFAA